MSRTHRIGLRPGQIEKIEDKYLQKFVSDELVFAVLEQIQFSLVCPNDRTILFTSETCW